MKIDPTNFGVTTSCEQMPNDELRFRLTGQNGSGYVLTVAGRDGAWQNAHLHLQCTETYIVERGWIAHMSGHKEPSWRLNHLFPGDILSFKPGQPHNIYISPNSILHTVKHGLRVPVDPSQPDWHAHAALDRHSKETDPAITPPRKPSGAKYQSRSQ